MLKKLMLGGALFFSVLAIGQRPAANSDEVVSGNGVIQKRVFKFMPIAEDKMEIWDVATIGQTTFQASNTVDGSASSFDHTTRIVVGLTTVGNKTNACQLVFYSSNDRVQQAATSNNGSVSIYFPIAVYDAMRSRLEQALLAKKKVQVKVTQRKDGYREGELIF